MIELTTEQAKRVLHVLYAHVDEYGLEEGDQDLLDRLEAEIEIAERLSNALDLVADGDEGLEETRENLLP